jgi:hypothetical protein
MEIGFASILSLSANATFSSETSDISTRGKLSRVNRKTYLASARHAKRGLGRTLPSATLPPAERGNGADGMACKAGADKGSENACLPRTGQSRFGARRGRGARRGGVSADATLRLGGGGRGFDQSKDALEVAGLGEEVEGLGGG